MRKKPASSPLEAALAALAKAMRRADVPWMAIGGIAIIAHGVRRLTTDIDAAVKGDAVEPAALLAVLRPFHIVPRIEGAEKFAHENLVLLMRHEPTGVELDVSLAWTAFELEALRNATPVRFGAAKAPMAQPEDLVIFKALASRPKDIDDAAALLILHPEIDVERVRRHVETLAALAEEPALLAGLERILARAEAARPRPRAAPRKGAVRKETARHPERKRAKKRAPRQR